MVEADSRRQVESRADLVLASAAEWSERNNFRFSVEKTEAVIFKGPCRRSPLVRTNGQQVKFKSWIKYLGVILDRKPNFRAHVSYVNSEKAKSLAVRLRSIAATRRVIRAPAMS